MQAPADLLGNASGGEPAVVEKGIARAGEDPADVPPFSRAALQELLWSDAGLVRDDAGLGHAASVLSVWRTQTRTPHTELDYENENLLVVAEHLVAAARARRGSVGAHNRRDDPVTSAPIRQEAVAC